MPDTPNLMPQLPAFAWPDPSRIDPVLGVALVTLEQQYGSRESIDRLIRAKVESKVWAAK